MAEIITLSCLHCNAEIEFHVEPWAEAPERAYCSRTCYQAADQVAQVTPATG